MKTLKDILGYELPQDTWIEYHKPDRQLLADYNSSMEGIDQTYFEWLESELKVAREFQRRFEAMEMLCIQRGIDTSEVRK